MRYLERASGFEEFLDQLNTVSGEITEPQISESPPTSTQIVGLPRSGTTVLYQLLARTGVVGYPSNVMAFFHRAPWVGAMLQQRLAENEPTLSLTSVAGRTPEPLDPHEFGYFWRRVCGHTTNTLTADAEPLEPARLQHELDLVAEVFDKPVVYKNFLALAHAEAMRRDLDRMCFISVERDRLDAAASLLDVRRRLAVPDDQLFGTAPPELRATATDPVDTVARQIVALSRQQATCGFDAHDDSIVVRYSELIRNPRQVIATLLEFLGVSTHGLPAAVPETLSSGAGAAALPADLLEQLKHALDRAERSAEPGPHESIEDESAPTEHQPAHPTSERTS